MSEEQRRLRREIDAYRQLLFAARPLEWVRTRDEEAARTWEGQAVLRLNHNQMVDYQRARSLAPELERPSAVEMVPMGISWLLFGIAALAFLSYLAFWLLH